MENRFILGQRIAEGGMAEVFAARMLGSEGFSKNVVVKRVLPQLARDPEFIARFLDEARLAAQLSHPGIVQVLQLVSDGTDLMMAMEAVDGADLSTILKLLRAENRTLALPLVLRVASAIAGALAYAHEKRDHNNLPLGIIHRDVTPSNILVSRDGATKLIDFGIARASSVARLTRQGSIIGKVAYMSPEQVRDLDVDARVDVWSCGVVFFHMLTGTRPFVGVDDTQIFQRIVAGERPDVRSLSAIPEALARVVDGCLAPDRSARIPTARALAHALDEVIAKEGQYASAAELGDLVSALVPAAAFESTARADGRSQTHSGISTLDELPGEPQPEDLNDTTPARKRPPSLTLDNDDPTFVSASRTTGRNGDAGSTVSSPLEIGELSTRILARPDQTSLFEHLSLIAPLPQPPLRSPLPQSPPLAIAPGKRARVALVGAALVIIGVGALGGFGAWRAGADDARRASAEQAPPSAPEPAAAAPMAPVATVEEVPSISDGAGEDAGQRTPRNERLRKGSVEKPRPKKSARGTVEPGTLIIDSRPWSTVKIDGVPVGATPIAPRKVAPGAHTIAFENQQQGLAKTVTVIVKSGEATTARVDLRR